IESFVPNEASYDLIISINVFEHLDDWRQGIDSSVRLLTDEGRLVFLCPNYTFPYEPHFGVPLFFGPKISRVFFDRRVRRIEKECDSAGLWDTLNFITAAQVADYCRRCGYRVEFDRDITSRMVSRLTSDSEFA